MGFDILPAPASHLRRRRFVFVKCQNRVCQRLRVFRLKDQAQFDAFAAAMDAAGKRVYPDPSKRPKSDELRDLVKRETWRGFR